MTKLFTKTGDQGTTSLATNQRVLKTDIRIEANGCIDELNATLGLAKAIIGESIAHKITPIQQILMDIMAAIAGKQIDDTSIKQATTDYENEMTAHEESFAFNVPGSSVANAILHLARAKARTCERRLWEVNATYTLSPNIMVYMNRLSDYLFYLSREA